MRVTPLGSPAPAAATFPLSRTKHKFLSLFRLFKTTNMLLKEKVCMNVCLCFEMGS